MTPREWLRANSDKLESKFESIFVLNVLGRIRDFYFEALQAQMPFRDSDGKPRRCDFAVKEGSEIRIAIEVDGYDKRGTGTGMTHEQFVDWQRRQAALVSQGWQLLRFANRDVSNHPEKCAEHISLLLRRERQKAEHQNALRRSVEGLEIRLKDDQRAEITSQEKSKLERELVTARRQLAIANASQELTVAEKSRLKELDNAMETIEILKKDAAIMKTTIWAFAAIIALVIVLLMFRTQSPAPTQQVDSTPPTAPVPQSPPLGSSCDNPRSWQEAGRYIGQSVALSGPVIGVTSNLEENGKPTWINIGAPFPSKDRLTLLIWGRNLNKFGGNLERLEGRSVCAFGEVQSFKGIAQVELKQSGQLVSR